MKIHVVKKSESMQDIAARHSLAPVELMAENALSSTRLCPGQCLFIPEELLQSRGSMELCAFFSHSPGLDSLCRSLPSYTYTGLWTHSFSPEGKLITPGAEFPHSFTRDFGCAPLLCLANLNPGGGFSPSLAHGLFTDKETKSCLINELIQKLEAGHYYGLHLSFNYLFPFDADNYSTFAAQMAEILHKAGFILSIELAPKDNTALSSGQDYVALSEAADRLSLMFCRWAHPFSPPQAMAPTAPLRRALEDAISFIPPQKLWLGISCKGYDWKLPWRQGDKAQPISNSRAIELAAAMGADIKRDASSNAPYFLYRDAEQKRHIVFFEDLLSLGDKLQLVEEFGLCGLSLYSAQFASAPVLRLLTDSRSGEKLL